MILQEVNRLTDYFDYVMLKHIYQEINTSADAFAKAGGLILEGYWTIKEHRADEVVEAYQFF